VSDIILTSNLRAMLCWLDETDGQPPKVGLKESNPHLAHELMRVLEMLGLTEAKWVKAYGWAYPLTDVGREQATLNRHNKTGQGCQSCVREHCVCRLSLVCLKGERHGGCQGSHE
jgi:hypothetical protein